MNTSADPVVTQIEEAASDPQKSSESASESHLEQQDEDRLARVRWSQIAEPTDPIAQALRALHGPIRALEIAREATAPELAAQLGHHVPVSDTDTRSASPTQRAANAVRRWRQRLGATTLDSALATLEQHRARILIPTDPAWPHSLDVLGEATPVCLYARGPHQYATDADPHAVAMVGSRASTTYGEDAAFDIGAGLAQEGITVVSGGAFGIDAAAHKGALAAQAAPVVCVLASSVDSLHPRGNARLLERIAAEHLVLSEAPPGTAPTRWRFLARNRLIAALAGVTVVVEAGFRSGALNTARWADDLSRPVAAVPGPITSAASAGCHRLIRERGAVLVTDAGSIAELLPGHEPYEQLQLVDELDALDPGDRRILDAVPRRRERSIEDLACDTGFDATRVLEGLGRLDLLGLVTLAGSHASKR